MGRMGRMGLDGVGWDGIECEQRTSASGASVLPAARTAARKEALSRGRSACHASRETSFHYGRPQRYKSLLGRAC